MTVLRAVGITLEKFFVFGIVTQLGQQAEHGLGHRALGESIIWFASVSRMPILRFFFLVFFLKDSVRGESRVKLNEL